MTQNVVGLAIATQRRHVGGPAQFKLLGGSSCVVAQNRAGNWIATMSQHCTVMCAKKMRLAGG
jgi:hypothetical protein